MSNKWFHSFAGYFFGGPIGGILGYFSGDVKDLVEEKMAQQQEDSGVNLLLLGAVIIKVNNHVNKTRLEFMEHYFSSIFGNEKAKIKLKFLNKVLTERYDYALIARDASREYDYGSKLIILKYLFGIALADGIYYEEDVSKISIIANNLDIKPADYLILKKRYFDGSTLLKSNNPYHILGLKGNETITEVTKTYRKLVLKFHPDRNSTLPIQEQKLLNVKFQEIKLAYEKIKQSIL